MADLGVYHNHVEDVLIKWQDKNKRDFMRRFLSTGSESSMSES